MYEISQGFSVIPELSQSLKTICDIFLLSEHHVIHICCSQFREGDIPWTAISTAPLRLSSKIPTYLQELSTTCQTLQ